MTITSSTVEPGIVAVTVDYPRSTPSRARAGSNWPTPSPRRPGHSHQCGDPAGRGPRLQRRRGHQEMQRTSGFTALIDANRGCFAAFKAVYECAVPVVAAVSGFCVGGGIGLVGNADVIVASDDARRSAFPKWSAGARRATHLSRLVPQHMMRRSSSPPRPSMRPRCITSDPCYRVVPRADLDEAALRVARDIAAKDTRVIRAAKER